MRRMCPSRETSSCASLTRTKWRVGCSLRGRCRCLMPGMMSAWCSPRNASTTSTRTPTSSTTATASSGSTCSPAMMPGASSPALVCCLVLFLLALLLSPTNCLPGYEAQGVMSCTSTHLQYADAFGQLLLFLAVCPYFFLEPLQQCCVVVMAGSPSLFFSSNLSS